MFVSVGAAEEPFFLTLNAETTKSQKKVAKKISVKALPVYLKEQPEAVTPTTELEMDNMDTFLERLPPSGKMTKTESLIISSNRY